MRLIDADAVIGILYRLTPFNSKGIQLFNSVEERINALPTIEIVRCKECKHWWNEYGDSACMLHSDFTVNADDFCSYGERREP